VTPLSSISISGMDATSCPHMSVAKSVSADLGTSMSCRFRDGCYCCHATIICYRNLSRCISLPKSFTWTGHSPCPTNKYHYGQPLKCANRFSYPTLRSSLTFRALCFPVTSLMTIEAGAILLSPSLFDCRWLIRSHRRRVDRMLLRCRAVSKRICHR